MSSIHVIVTVLSVISTVYTQNACVTPNGVTAVCISIHECDVLLNAVKDKFRSQETLKFLRASQCGFQNVPLVCCGSVAGYQSENSNETSNTNTNTQSVSNLQENIKLLPPNDFCGVRVTSERIIGGIIPSFPDEYPWLALLEYQKDGQTSGHKCGGVLINNRYILTAAHCLTGEIVQNFGNVYRVRLGEFNTTSDVDCVEDFDFIDCADPHQDISVEEVIPHADYVEDQNRYHDIGLIRLSRNVSYSDFIRPICLPLNGSKSNPGRYFEVAGWGYTPKNASSTVLNRGRIQPVSQQNCSSIYASKFDVKLKNSQLCAGGVRKASCYMNDGGPLTYQSLTTDNYIPHFYAEGIASFGITCHTDTPGIFTRVSEYANWILANLKQ